MGRNRWDVLSLLLQPPILAALELAVYDVPILAASEPAIYNVPILAGIVPAAGSVLESGVCDA